MSAPDLSPVLELRSTGASHGQELLIVFSARKAPRFHFYKATDGMRCDLLFVRDPYLTAWYQRGLGVGEDLESLTSLLRRIIRPYRTVRAVGSSMGGYAALYFAAQLNLPQALALVPQIVVDARLARGPTRGHDIVCPDIGPLLRASRNTQFLIALGGLDLVDLGHVARLWGDDGLPEHIRIGTYSRQDHMLPAHLAAHAPLGSYFQDSFAAGHPVAMADAGHAHGLPLDRHQRALALRCLTLLRRRDIPAACTLLRESRAAMPDWPARDHLLVELAPAANLPDNSVARLAESLARRFPDSLHCRYQAARIATSLGDAGCAHAHLSAIFAARPAHPGARALQERLRTAEAVPA